MIQKFVCSNVLRLVARICARVARSCARRPSCLQNCSLPIGQKKALELQKCNWALFSVSIGPPGLLVLVYRWRFLVDRSVVLSPNLRVIYVPPEKHPCSVGFFCVWHGSGLVPTRDPTPRCFEHVYLKTTREDKLACFFL